MRWVQKASERDECTGTYSNFSYQFPSHHCFHTCFAIVYTHFINMFFIARHSFHHWWMKMLWYFIITTTTNCFASILLQLQRIFLCLFALNWSLRRRTPNWWQAMGNKLIVCCSVNAGKLTFWIEKEIEAINIDTKIHLHFKFWMSLKTIKSFWKFSTS